MPPITLLYEFWLIGKENLKNSKKCLEFEELLLGIVKRTFQKLLPLQGIRQYRVDLKWRSLMTDFELSNDDKLCLRLWFRQAIVQLEKEEVHAQLLRFHDSKPGSEKGHRPSIGRRTCRNPRVAHIKELA